MGGRTGLWSDCCDLLASLVLSTACAGAETTVGPAERLVRALQRREVTTIAAHDPTAPRRVVAARAFGRTQITVLAGVVEAPEVDGWLTNGRSEEVYRWLLAQPARRDGFVLHDLNGVGLRADHQPGHAFDMFAPSGGPQVAFDGDWGMQGLTTDEYCAAFVRAEQAYGHALEILLTTLDRDSPPR